MNQTEKAISQFKVLQTCCCETFAGEDGEAEFRSDEWHYDNGGGGISRVIENGRIFEKGGVNFSHIMGDKLPASASATRSHIAGKPFEATGVSLVMHPQNPYVPTTHMNVRYFVADLGSENPVWWFGGGFDLTPYYGFDEDCMDWHQAAKLACDKLSPDAYQDYKQQCDDYFYIKHRNEQRGIGGIFFDDLNAPDFDSCLKFAEAVGSTLIDTYLPIVQRRSGMQYGEPQKQFQRYRRGRYVEFNLVYDRGTLFGLQSGGRTESILMSLPPEVIWQYDYQAEPSSEEQKLLDYYLKPRDWLGLKS